jgi:hypothetical protein
MILTTLSLAGWISIPLELQVSQCPLSCKPVVQTEKKKQQ